MAAATIPTPATPAPTVYRLDDPDPDAWGRFIAAMHSGRPFECDEEMWYHWLECLPPVHMGKTVILDGIPTNVSFGFAEGSEPITVFWRVAGRHFGQRTAEINTRCY